MNRQQGQRELVTNHHVLQKSIRSLDMDVGASS